MKEKFRIVILSLTIAIFITFYVVRLFAFLYNVPATISVKSRAAIEQPHLRAETKRLERYGNKLR